MSLQTAQHPSDLIVSHVAALGAKEYCRPALHSTARQVGTM